MRPSERPIRNQQEPRYSLGLSVEWTNHCKVSTLEERREHHSVGQKAFFSKVRFGHANCRDPQLLLDNDSGTAMTLEQSILDAIRTLPAEKKVELLSFVEKLKGDESKPLRESGYGLLSHLNV